MEKGWRMYRSPFSHSDLKQYIQVKCRRSLIIDFNFDSYWNFGKLWRKL